MKAGNQTLLKKNNQRAIINYIINNGPISRADLSKKLKISKPTVSANIQELMDLNLLKEIGFCETDIGKKPILVDFNRDFKYVLAIDFISYIARNQINFAVCNLTNEPIFVETISLPRKYDASSIKNDIPKAMLDLLNKNNISIDDIGKVVLTASTPSYDENNIIFVCPNGDKINLSKVFSPYFGGKIAVKNDINLAALGEKYFGVGKEADSLIFMWVGLNVGGGIIINGELYEGKHNTAGEIGFSYVYNEVLNKYEYIQDITSMRGIKNYILANKASAKKSIIADKLLHDDFLIENIVQAALNGDSFCIEFGKYIGKLVSRLISNISTTMDFEMAIIGGDYALFGEIFLNEVKIGLKGNVVANTEITTPQYTNSAMYGSFKVGTDSIISGLI